MKSHALTRKWFRNWSNEYDNTLGRIGFHRGLVDLMVKELGASEASRVLDIGCGTGLSSLKLLKKAGCDITAIDNSREMMGIFRDKVKKLRLRRKITCRLMDANGLDFEKNSFDGIISAVTLHHIKDKPKLLRSIRGILKPGGRLVIGDIDMDSTGSHSDVDRLKRMLRVLEEEFVFALKDAGARAFSRIYDNAKKHIFNEGEYCVSLGQWAAIARRAGFRRVKVKKLSRYRFFGVVVADK